MHIPKYAASIQSSKEKVCDVKMYCNTAFIINSIMLILVLTWVKGVLIAVWSFTNL